MYLFTLIVLNVSVKIASVPSALERCQFLLQLACLLADWISTTLCTSLTMICPQLSMVALRSILIALVSPKLCHDSYILNSIGRTGRIGNMGLATSFYNDRDSDLGETLTKTLLETHQVVPDFLEQYIPEGFTADGAGDINQLKFDADSDEEDENAAESGEGNAGGAPASGWGTEPAVGGKHSAGAL